MPATTLAGEATRDLRLAADASQLSRARRFAEMAAQGFGFDEEETYAFKFAASEAVANAIEHGEPCDDGTIGIGVSEERFALTFHVCDCGTYLPQSDDTGHRGRGLMFMEAMVDEVELEAAEQSTVVRLTKRRATP